MNAYCFKGAVIPRYGRIVLFRNIIDHSARPPSPDFLAARYTFAVKVLIVLLLFRDVNFDEFIECIYMDSVPQCTVFTPVQCNYCIKTML